MERLEYMVLTAVYDAKDRGNRFRDDRGGFSLLPSARPIGYEMDGRVFGSPEELMTYYSCAYDGGSGLMLNMNDSDAADFVRLWREAAGKKP